MARAHALSKGLASSSSSVNDLVWPYPGFGRGSDNTDTLKVNLWQYSGSEVSQAWRRFPRPSARLETAARRIWWASPYFYRSGNDSVNR